MDLLGLLNGGLSAVNRAKSAQLEGAGIKREREQADLLAQIESQRKAQQDSEMSAYRTAQTKNLEDEIARRASAPNGGEEPENYGVSLQEVVDPATGKRVLVQAGNRGTQRVSTYQPVPQADPRPPQGSPVRMEGEDGRPVFFNPVTREVVEAPAGLKPEGSDRVAAATGTRMAEGRAQLDAIRQARTALRENPQSVGLKRGLSLIPGMGQIGDLVNQNADPAGNKARQYIANVASLQIKDRSGSAVTVSEFPRLAAFVPNVYDTPEKINTNLDALERELTIVLNALAAGATLAEVMSGTTSGSAGTAGSPPPRNAAPAPSYEEWKRSQGRTP